MTKPIDGVHPAIPMLRDPDHLVYFREEVGGLVAGGYEREPAPWGLDGIPADFNHRLLPPDWERFAPLMEGAVHRVPAIGSAEIVRLINGPEAFTPDGEFILGESPEVRGFFVACGFCAHGIAGAGGMGRIMADWIVEGDPGLDVWHMDLRRFGAQYRSRRLTLERTHEVYRTYYDLRYPNQEREEGRRLRLSPAYPRLRELGASFGEKSGWERPNWFEPNAAAGDEGRRPRGFAGPDLVTRDRGRAPRDARAGGALRRDVLLEAGGGRARARSSSSSGSAATTSTSRSARSCTRPCSTRGAASSATSR